MPRYSNRNGDRLWYEERGAGFPVVLLHGWCMSSAVWKYQLAGMTELSAAGRRIIAPDLRGHGSSRPVSGTTDFAALADDLTDLFDELQLTRAVLVGWSLGAQLALYANAGLSDRLAGMVLVSATSRFTATDDFPHGVSPVEAAGMRLKVQRSLERALEGFHTGLFAAGELDRNGQTDEVKELLAAIPLPEKSVVLEALDALTGADMRSLLGAIRSPTLIINGDQDRVCLPGASGYLKMHIDHAEQTVFPHCGHAPFVTRSHQFNAELDRFVRSVCEQNN